MSEKPNAHILIVDDHAENREFLSRRLQKKGYATSEAEDGSRALKMLDQEPYDLVLLDIMMPGLDGQEVLKRIRQEYATLDLPVIMLTAKDDSTDMVEALGNGANDYVTKPVNFKVLLARIQNHLSIRNQALSIDAAYSSTKEDLYRLEELQQSLFPMGMPEVEGFQLSYARLPSWQLGGDVLNFFKLDDLHIGVYLLDVIGHGPEAALLASTLSHLLSPAETEKSVFWERPGQRPFAHVLSPASAVAKLQQQLPSEPDKDLQFSLHYGIIDLSDQSYTYVSIGQPTPVLLRAGEEPRVLPTDLGLLGDTSGEVVFHEHRMGKFEQDDQLYICSDGIDAFKDHHGLSEKPENLVRLLCEEQKDASLKDRLGALVYLVGEQGEEPRSDDITILGIQAAL